MSATSNLMAQWEGLNEREKTLVRALGGVAVALVVLLPAYMLSTAIGELETESEEIAAVLSEIARADARLAEREAERAASEARYATRAPELGTFLEGRASARAMTIASVTSEPEQQEGRFRKRLVRASFPGATLRQAVRLMTDVESAPYPLALERVHVDHPQEGDRFNVELGVVTYDRTSVAADGGVPAGPSAASAAPNARVQPPGAAGVRAGPPPPP